MTFQFPEKLTISHILSIFLETETSYRNFKKAPSASDHPWTSYMLCFEFIMMLACFRVHKWSKSMQNEKRRLLSAFTINFWWKNDFFHIFLKKSGGILTVKKAPFRSNPIQKPFRRLFCVPNITGASKGAWGVPKTHLEKKAPMICLLHTIFKILCSFLIFCQFFWKLKRHIET